MLGYNVCGMTFLARSTTSEALGTGSVPGRVLAIDYGRRRIGLAVSDELRVTAQPLAKLERTNRSDDVRRLREIARRHQARLVIVGHPLHLDGRAGEMAEEAARFAARIQKAMGIPVELVDERLTSWEAAQTLAQTATRSHSGEVGAHKPQRPGRARARTPRRPATSSSRRAIDDVAAAVLLREYLERPHSPEAARELQLEKDQRQKRVSD